MSEQQTLFEQPPKLTERQAWALERVRSSYKGLTDVELGVQLHVRQGKHDGLAICEWCATTGREVLTALRRKGLVVRRRKTGKWVVKDAGQVGEPSITGTGSCLSEPVPAPYDPATADIPF